MNIVYNEILIYRNGKREYPNSNIAQYDVHPWHTGDYTNLKVIEDTYGIKFPYHIKGGEDPKFLELIELFRSQQIQVFLDHNYNRHKVYTLDEITNIRVNYIYPIVIYPIVPIITTPSSYIIALSAYVITNISRSR